MASSDIQWTCSWRCDKYRDGEETPYEIREIPGNILTYSGASNIWQTLIGNGTTTAGQPLTYFNTTNAAIGVGDSSTAAAATQTDLQASSNKFRKAMSASYPSHTASSTSVTAETITFQSNFTTGEANFAWAEWGIFNSTSAGVGCMLNRKVDALGTKTNADTWVMTATISVA